MQENSAQYRIQMFSGGLGNQMMEYIFLRYAERRRPEAIWILDDLFYHAYDYLPVLQQFENIFHVKWKRISQLCEEDTLEELIRLYRKNIRLPQILLSQGIPVIRVSEYTYGLFQGMTLKKKRGYSPEILNLSDRYVYYDSIFMDRCWFMQDREENLAELAFPPLLDARNQRYADAIRANISVGIHVRRGDFLQVGWAFHTAAYRKSCEMVLERYPDAWFFVFSNDLDWCRRHAAELGFNFSKHTVYVSGNEAFEKNYMDMQLLSMCRGMIRLGLSTFSSVASWIDQNLAFEALIGDLYGYRLEAQDALTFLERNQTAPI